MAATDPPSQTPASPRVQQALRRYWRSNLLVMLVLLSIWVLVGPVLSILVADKINGFKLGGFPLGFWFAQQGSIITFVLLILVYAILMNRLDRRHHDDLNGKADRTPEA